MRGLAASALVSVYSGLLAMHACAWQEPAAPLSLPATVGGDVGDFIVVRAATAGKQVRWVCLDSGLKMFPPELVADSKVCVVVARAPGKYRLLAYSSVGDAPTPPAVCTVVVGAGPEPFPPVPPAPPTPPTDPLAQALQALYAADPGSQKAAHRASLAALYRQAVATAADPQVKTTGELFAVLKSATTNLIPADAILPVRTKIAQELLAVLGNPSAIPLDAVTRDRAAQEFAKIAAALESLR